MATSERFSSEHMLYRTFASSKMEKNQAPVGGERVSDIVRTQQSNNEVTSL